MRFFDGVFSTRKALALSSGFYFMEAAPLFPLLETRNTKLEAASPESEES